MASTNFTAISSSLNTVCSNRLIDLVDSIENGDKPNSIEKIYDRKISKCYEKSLKYKKETDSDDSMTSYQQHVCTANNLIFNTTTTNYDNESIEDGRTSSENTLSHSSSLNEENEIFVQSRDRLLVDRQMLGFTDLDLNENSESFTYSLFSKRLNGLLTRLNQNRSCNCEQIRRRDKCKIKFLQNHENCSKIYSHEMALISTTLNNQHDHSIISRSNIKSDDDKNCKTTTMTTPNGSSTTNFDHMDRLMEGIDLNDSAPFSNRNQRSQFQRRSRGELNRHRRKAGKCKSPIISGEAHVITEHDFNNVNTSLKCCQLLSMAKSLATNEKKRRDVLSKKWGSFTLEQAYNAVLQAKSYDDLKKLDFFPYLNWNEQTFQNFQHLESMRHDSTTSNSDRTTLKAQVNGSYTNEPTYPQSKCSSSLLSENLAAVSLCDYCNEQNHINKPTSELSHCTVGNFIVSHSNNNNRSNINAKENITDGTCNIPINRGESPSRGNDDEHSANNGNNESNDNGNNSDNNENSVPSSGEGTNKDDESDANSTEDDKTDEESNHDWYLNGARNENYSDSMICEKERNIENKKLNSFETRKDLHTRFRDIRARLIGLDVDHDKMQEIHATMGLKDGNVLDRTMMASLHNQLNSYVNTARDNTDFLKNKIPMFDRSDPNAADYLLTALQCGHCNYLKSFLVETNELDISIESNSCFDEPKGHTTALMEAANCGNYDLVKRLLIAGADVNAKSVAKNTALHFAALSGHSKIIDCLIRWGANVEEANDNGHTPLMEAAQAGHLTAAEILINHGAGVNAHSNEFKESALTLACYKGNLEMVDLLLKKGADKQHKTDEMHTALMEACMDGHTDVAKMLIDHGVEVNMPSDGFESPLTLASCGGHYELVKLLLDRKADIEEINDEGYTPLMEAAREGHVTVTEVLLKYGANVNAITEETQETALSLACCGGFIDVVRLLVEHNADVDMGGTTPLMEAAQEGHIEVVQYLLEKKADVDLQALNGDTALQLASEYGHTKVVSLLLNYGANVNTIDRDNERTPLMRACKSGYLDTVELLISKGANVNAISKKKDLTPLSCACSSGYPHIVTSLIKAGADIYQKLHDNSNCIMEAARSGHANVMNTLFLYIRGCSLAIEKALEEGTAAKRLQLIEQVEDAIKTGVLDVAADDVRNRVFPCLPKKQETPANEKTTKTNQATKTQKNQRSNKKDSRKIAQEILSGLGYDCNDDEDNSNTNETSQKQSKSKNKSSPEKDSTNQCHACIAISTGQSKKSHLQHSPMCPRHLVDRLGLDTLIKEELIGDPESTPLRLKFINSSIDSSGDTALTLACLGGHVDSVSVLIGEGADIERRDSKGLTPLMISSTAGHLNVTQILINRGADIEACMEKTRDTSLSLTASTGHNEIVSCLLNAGANREHRNSSDYTPLCLAASGGFVDTVKTLLHYGADINSRASSKLGITPLMLAAMNGHLTTTKILLEMGADINAQIETNKNTALTLACYQGRYEVVKVLIDHKANIEHRAKTGLTPLMEAASGGFTDVGALLIEKGADVNSPPVPSSRDTPLTIAADKGHDKFVQMLLDNNATIDARNKKFASALWLASNNGHYECVELLVERGATVDIEDNRKVSALMAAFKRGFLKIVKYLVKHVRQFPSDTECAKYISSLPDRGLSGDRELRNNCKLCMDIILSAKDHQTLEADKAASNLLEELNLEKSREESKKQAAAKKRAKKKLRRQNKRHQSESAENQADIEGVKTRSNDDVNYSLQQSNASEHYESIEYSDFIKGNDFTELEHDEIDKKNTSEVKKDASEDPKINSSLESFSTKVDEEKGRISIPEKNGNDKDISSTPRLTKVEDNKHVSKETVEKPTSETPDLRDKRRSSDSTSDKKRDNEGRSSADEWTEVTTRTRKANKDYICKRSFIPSSTKENPNSVNEASASRVSTVKPTVGTGVESSGGQSNTPGSFPEDRDDPLKTTTFYNDSGFAAVSHGHLKHTSGQIGGRKVHQSTNVYTSRNINASQQPQSYTRFGHSRTRPTKEWRGSMYQHHRSNAPNTCGVYLPSGSHSRVFSHENTADNRTPCVSDMRTFPRLEHFNSKGGYYSHHSPPQYKEETNDDVELNKNETSSSLLKSNQNDSSPSQVDTSNAKIESNSHEKSPVTSVIVENSNTAAAQSTTDKEDLKQQFHEDKKEKSTTKLDDEESRSADNADSMSGYQEKPLEFNLQEKQSFIEINPSAKEHIPLQSTLTFRNSGVNDECLFSECSNSEEQRDLILNLTSSHSISNYERLGMKFASSPFEFSLRNNSDSPSGTSTINNISSEISQRQYSADQPFPSNFPPCDIDNHWNPQLDSQFQRSSYRDFVQPNTNTRGGRVFNAQSFTGTQHPSNEYFSGNASHNLDMHNNDQSQNNQIFQNQQQQQQRVHSNRNEMIAPIGYQYNQRPIRFSPEQNLPMSQQRINVNLTAELYARHHQHLINQDQNNRNTSQVPPEISGSALSDLAIQPSHQANIQYIEDPTHAQYTVGYNPQANIPMQFHQAPSGSSSNFPQQGVDLSSQWRQLNQQQQQRQNNVNQTNPNVLVDPTSTITQQSCRTQPQISNTFDPATVAAIHAEIQAQQYATMFPPIGGTSRQINTEASSNQQQIEAETWSSNRHRSPQHYFLPPQNQQNIQQALETMDANQWNLDRGMMMESFQMDPRHQTSLPPQTLDPRQPINNRPTRPQFGHGISELSRAMAMKDMVDRLQSLVLGNSSQNDQSNNQRSTGNAFVDSLSAELNDVNAGVSELSQNMANMRSLMQQRQHFGSFRQMSAANVFPANTSQPFMIPGTTSHQQGSFTQAVHGQHLLPQNIAPNIPPQFNRPNQQGLASFLQQEEINPISIATAQHFNRSNQSQFVNNGNLQSFLQSISPSMNSIYHSGDFNNALSNESLNRLTAQLQSLNNPQLFNANQFSQDPRFFATSSQNTLHHQELMPDYSRQGSHLHLSEYSQWANEIDQFHGDHDPVVVDDDYQRMLNREASAVTGSTDNSRTIGAIGSERRRMRQFNTMNEYLSSDDRVSMPPPPPHSHNN